MRGRDQNYAKTRNEESDSSSQAGRPGNRENRDRLIVSSGSPVFRVPENWVLTKLVAVGRLENDLTKILYPSGANRMLFCAPAAENFDLWFAKILADCEINNIAVSLAKIAIIFKITTL